MRTPLLIFLGQFSIVLVAAVLRVSNKNWQEFHSASFVVVSLIVLMEDLKIKAENGEIGHLKQR